MTGSEWALFIIVLFGPSIKFCDPDGTTRFIYKGLLIAFIEKAIDMTMKLLSEEK